MYWSIFICHYKHALHFSPLCSEHQKIVSVNLINYFPSLLNSRSFWSVPGRWSEEETGCNLYSLSFLPSRLYRDKPTTPKPVRLVSWLLPTGKASSENHCSSLSFRPADSGCDFPTSLMVEHRSGRCWFPFPWSQLCKETLLNSLQWGLPSVHLCPHSLSLN